MGLCVQSPEPTVSAVGAGELVGAVTSLPSVFRVPRTEKCQVSAFEAEDWVLALRPSQTVLCGLEALLSFHHFCQEPGVPQGDELVSKAAVLLFSTQGQGRAEPSHGAAGATDRAIDNVKQTLTVPPLRRQHRGLRSSLGAAFMERLGLV